LSNSSEPLYTKYRPKKLSDVVGQDVVVRVLTNSFNNGTLHHAYIMSGKMGTGKTSTGRILAAMVNCEKGPRLEPCGECKTCKEIFVGMSVDVKEIDAASNRGIDDIRELKKDVWFAPISCRKKFIIVDECHSLSGPAAEAMLKLIEEPPDNVMFALCTTEPEKLKDTIHSRCISFTFRSIPWPELFKFVAKITKLENREVDEEALKFIGKSAKGSARNALQNLQFVFDYAESGLINLDIAQKALGDIDESLYYKLVEAIADDKIPDAWKMVSELMVKGKNSEIIVEGLETYLRNLMLIPLCQDVAHEMGFSEQEIKRFVYQSRKIKPILAIEMQGLLQDVQRSISLNLSPEHALCRFIIASIIVKKKLSAKKVKQEQGAK